MQANREIQKILNDEIEYSSFYKEDSLSKLEEIMSSDLSILGLWICLAGDNIKIKPRANNIYYSDCVFHNADDLPVLISEKDKVFFCYGCGKGGTILTLAKEYLGLGYETRYALQDESDSESHYVAFSYDYSDEVVNIFYAFIKNNISFLNEEEKRYYDILFNNYNLDKVNYYKEISRLKTEQMNQRIDNYCNSHAYFDGLEKKMSKRLCYSKKYITEYLKKK